MAIQVVTPPSVEPITYEEAKAHLRRFDDEEEDLINQYIAAATEDCEIDQNRAYITQSILYTLNQWPSRPRICLPRAPLQSVAADGVRYRDSDGNMHTFDAANYTVNANEEPGMIILNPDRQWPTAQLYPYGAIEITFTAGYPQVGPVDHIDEAVGIGDDTETTFYLANPPIVAGSETIYENGFAVPPADYTLDLETGETVFATAPGAGVAITADYTEAADLRANVPKTIKQAILFLVAHYMENREEVASRGHIPQIMPRAARWLLAKDPIFWTEELNR